jgi:hypothetical protein
MYMSFLWGSVCCVVRPRVDIAVARRCTAPDLGREQAGITLITDFTPGGEGEGQATFI